MNFTVSSEETSCSLFKNENMPLHANRYLISEILDGSRQMGVADHGTLERITEGRPVEHHLGTTPLCLHCATPYLLITAPNATQMPRNPAAQAATAGAFLFR